METLFQLFLSDQILALEVVALFSIGFYLIAAVKSFPERISPRHLSYAKISPLRGKRSHRYIVAETTIGRPKIQIGFGFATLMGVGAVMSPPRTWLKQNF